MAKRKRSTGLVQLGPGMRPLKLVTYEDFNRGTEPQGIVCQRCSEGPPAVPSKVATCDRCLAKVWIAPSTLEAVSQMRAPTILCMACMVDDVQKEVSDG